MKWKYYNNTKKFGYESKHNLLTFFIEKDLSRLFELYWRDENSLKSKFTFVASFYKLKSAKQVAKLLATG